MDDRRDNQRSARRVALEALNRIERESSYANLALGPILERSKLSGADRSFVTLLVYGTIRMRRACDALVDRFIAKEPDPEVRQILRLGAYQICFLDVPAHAAVGETVELAPARVRGFVNAILRKVATVPMHWSSDAERLSYPNWIVDRFMSEMTAQEAIETLETMNRAAVVTMRSDGYVQDRASQDVVDALGVRTGDRVLDLCAGPGGKATGLSARGASVFGCDVNATRARLVARNAETTGHPVHVFVGDARRTPLRDETFERVLVDAPCSGLGVLRRRPDARWRIRPDDIDDLVLLQREILVEAARLVRVGGVLAYSVCTVTRSESLDHEVPLGFAVIDARGDGDLPPLPTYWNTFGTGSRVLPPTADTDGMIILRYRRTS